MNTISITQIPGIGEIVMGQGDSGMYYVQIASLLDAEVESAITRKTSAEALAWIEERIGSKNLRDYYGLVRGGEI